jgi:hypothetical protein
MRGGFRAASILRPSSVYERWTTGRESAQFRPIKLKWWSLGVQEFQPSKTPAIYDRNTSCRPMKSADQTVEYLPPRKHHALPVQPPNASGNCPALRRIVGWSSNSPSYASPEVENATTSNSLATSRSAVLRAASADLHTSPQPHLSSLRTKCAERQETTRLFHTACLRCLYSEVQVSMCISRRHSIR